MNAFSEVSATSPVAESVRQRRKEARPGELIAAALELFVQRGFSATRLDDVAKQAGVSKGTLYLYFDSKEALFKAAIQEGVVPVLDDISGMIENFDGNPVDRMEALVLYWWRTVGATPLGGIPKLMISEARNFPDVAAFYQEVVIDRSHEMIRKTLQRAITDGLYRDVDVESAVELLFAPLLMLVVWRHSFGANGCLANSPYNNPEKYLRAHIDLVMNGLLAGSARSLIGAHS